MNGSSHLAFRLSETRPASRVVATVTEQIQSRHGGTYVSVEARHYLGVVPRGTAHVWHVLYDGVPVSVRVVSSYVIASGSGGGIARDLPCEARWGFNTSVSDWRERLEYCALLAENSANAELVGFHELLPTDHRWRGPLSRDRQCLRCGIIEKSTPLPGGGFTYRFQPCQGKEL